MERFEGVTFPGGNRVDAKVGGDVAHMDCGRATVEVAIAQRDAALAYAS